MDTIPDTLNIDRRRFSKGAFGVDVNNANEKLDARLVRMVKLLARLDAEADLAVALMERKQN